MNGESLSTRFLRRSILIRVASTFPFSFLRFPNTYNSHGSQNNYNYMLRFGMSPFPAYLRISNTT